MAQSFDDYKDRLDEFVNKGSTEWDAFLDWWKVKNPEPTEERIIKRPVNFNIKFWLALASGLGALALSGFRVSERFFSVAGGYTEGTNPLFTYGEAVSGVLAVNVTIFALAVAYAYTSKKMSEYSQVLGLGTAILISSVAGLGQGAKALGPEWATFVSVFDLVLAVVLGIGATALEYFSGDLLGVEIVRYSIDKEKSNQEYEQAVSNERSRVVHEHREWVRNAKGQFGLFMSNFGKFNGGSQKLDNVHEQSVNNREQTTNNKSNTVSKLDIMNTLREHYERSRTILGVSELTRELAMNTFGFDMNNLTLDQKTIVNDFVHSKKGNVSQVRNKWIIDNNLTE